jgi:Cd2+/Zn2+-exporting ATPase
VRTAGLATLEAPIGVIVIDDSPRSDGAEAVRQLAALGIAHQAMVTGDNERVANSVAGGAGIGEVHAKLLPEDKIEIVRRFQREYGPVGMVGDGINDAPALAAADLGIVMGAAGGDTAMETADIALMADDLSRLPYILKLSRSARAIIRQNIAFSLATKGQLLRMALFVGVPLWLAVVGDAGMSLAVTLNALRLAAFRHEPSQGAV